MDARLLTELYPSGTLLSDLHGFQRRPSAFEAAASMASLNAENITRPVEQINVSSLPEADAQDAANALEALVEGSGQQADLSYNTLAFAHNIGHIPWLHNLFPGLEELAAKYHIGNFVVVRGTGEKFFESMPIYARYVFTMSVQLFVSLTVNQDRYASALLRTRSDGHLEDGVGREDLAGAVNQGASISL